MTLGHPQKTLPGITPSPLPNEIEKAFLASLNYPSYSATPVRWIDAQCEGMPKAITFVEIKVGNSFVKPPKAGQQVHEIFPSVNTDPKGWYVTLPPMLELTSSVLPSFTSPPD
jgi:hypothetical protein